MNAEHLRNLKHELRTPVNHILGYSELLLETATDAGDKRMAAVAEKIHANGQAIARLLEKTFLSATSDADTGFASTWGSDARPVIQQIVEMSVPSPDFCDIDSYAGDLQKIRNAANHLICLIAPDAPPTR